MAKDLSTIHEPPADPLARRAKRVPPAKLPPVAVLEQPTKHVERYRFEVYAICDGVTYGPMEQVAVDESEAIQRALDAGDFDGLNRAQCQHRAVCLESARREEVGKAAKAARIKAKEQATT